MRKILSNPNYAGALLVVGVLVVGMVSFIGVRILRPFAEPDASADCEPALTGAEVQASFAGRARERVRIVDHTLVTDTGQILRAAHGNSRNTVFMRRSWWTTMRDRYGLNAIRLDTRITSRPTNAEYPDSTDHLIDVVSVFDSCRRRCAKSGRSRNVRNPRKLYVLLRTLESRSQQSVLERSGHSVLG